MIIDYAELEHTVNVAKKFAAQPAWAKKIISLVDLTTLNESDTETVVAALCQKAVNHYGHVAAVCIYPAFVKYAVEQLVDSPVKVATVANFPHATDSLENVQATITQSIADGVDEIDVVFPYPAYLAGDRQTAKNFIAECKKACGKNIVLKVILETGVLKTVDIIAAVSADVIEAGADFLKTSTGKTAIGATLEAAAAMLLVIRQSGLPVGFKASGGVRTIEQACQYIGLANQIMGPEWVSPRTFRLGASQLVDAILLDS